MDFVPDEISRAATDETSRTENEKILRSVTAEALRYLGVHGVPPDDVHHKVLDAAQILTRSVKPRQTYRVFTLRRDGQTFALSDAVSVRGDSPVPGRDESVPGRDESVSGRDESDFGQSQTVLTLTGKTVSTMLSDCQRVVILLCTLGAGFETRLRALQARDMAGAVIWDACASAWVETGCDAAEKEIAARFPGKYLTDRFSPGYGDLPLTLQRDICTLLDSQRRLGVHVTDTLLLNPAKSVTAFIGLADRPQMARVRGCACCTMRESCAIRKGGNRCGIEIPV